MFVTFHRGHFRWNLEIEFFMWYTASFGGSHGDACCRMHDVCCRMHAAFFYDEYLRRKENYGSSFNKKICDSKFIFTWYLVMHAIGCMMHKNGSMKYVVGCMLHSLSKYILVWTKCMMYVGCNTGALSKRFLTKCIMMYAFGYMLQNNKGGGELFLKFCSNQFAEN